MRMYFINSHSKVWGYEMTTGFINGEPRRKSLWVNRGDSEMHLYGTYGEAADAAKRINPTGLPCITVGSVEVPL